MRSYRDQIVAVLAAHPDGISTTAVAGALGKAPTVVLKALKRTPYAYIDRWAEKKRQYTAIWCLVQMPEHCPHPLRGGKVIETTWRNI